jgi:hypothetical protein
MKNAPRFSKTINPVGRYFVMGLETLARNVSIARFSEVYQPASLPDGR